MDPLLDLVARRIHAYVGLSIVGWGHLESDYHGHSEDTPFVTVFASTLDERQFAKRKLADIAGLNDLAWDYGWEPKQRCGKFGSVIKIFPSLD